MTDIVSEEKRSANMAVIHGKDTSPEIYIRKILFSEGYRYRKNSSKVFGHPDIYLAKYNTAVFVNGCFWHRHEGCRYAYIPKSRIDFWIAKFESNRKRDALVRKTLYEENIKQLVIWECTVKTMKKDSEFQKKILNRIENFFNDKEQYLEL